MRSNTAKRVLGSAHIRRLLQCGTALPLALLATPAYADCVVEGDTTTCTGQIEAGVNVSTPNLVIRDVTGDISLPAGQLVWAPELASGDIDLGDHTLSVQGIPAIAAIVDNAVTVDFKGTINATGPNSLGGGSSGINVDSSANGGWNATVRSTGDITVNASREGDDTWQNNVGIAAIAGANGAAAVTSTGTIDITVAGNPTVTWGILATGGAGAAVSNTGDITVSTTGLFGNGIYAGSDGDVVIESVGNIAASANSESNPAAAGHGISAAGLRNTITSRGNISTDGSGIISRGVFDAATFTNGIAETSEIVSDGDIATSADGSPAILAMGEVVTVDSSGNITTAGNTAAGIYASRSFAFDPGTGTPTYDNSGASASVTHAGDITTLGAGSHGIHAGSAGETTVAVAGTITTNGTQSAGINAHGGTVVIEASGAIVTSGEGSHGINVTTAGGNVTIASNSVQTTGAGEVFGISAVTSGGDIAIDSGTVHVASTGADNGRGINANSGGGDIVINAGTTTGHTRAIYTTTLFEGPVLGFTAGNTTITSESATATGGSAIIGQGYSVNLTSGRAEGTANADFTSATIYVSAGAGGATVTAGETVSHGFGQYGIQVLSVGDLRIDSGSVTTHGEYNNGITAFGNSLISVDSGSVSTSGIGSHGIYVDGYTVYGSAPVDIVSETITTAGDYSNGIYVWSFDESAGMTGDITIDSGTIDAGGTLSHGIVVASTADPGYVYRPVSAFAGTGALSIASDSIVADGPGGRGIVLDHAGPITVDSGSIVADAGGIYMWAGSSVDVTSGTLYTRDGPGIVVYGAAGDVTVNAGTTEVGPDGDAGIYAETTSGNVTIVADQTHVDGSANTDPHFADAISGVSASGNVSIVSNSASSAGHAGSAIYAFAGGDVSVVSGTAATTGDLGVAVGAVSGGGDASLTLGSLTATGAGAAGAFVSAASGTASIVTSGDVTVADGYALRARGAQVSIETGAGTTTGGTTGIRVHEGVTEVEGVGPVLLDGFGSAEIVNGGTVIGTGSGLGSGGISVALSGDISIISNAVESTGSSSFGIYARSGYGNVTIDSGSVVLTADQPQLFVTLPNGQVQFNDYAAVRALALTGTAEVRVDDVTALGANGRGVVADGLHASVTVDGQVQAATTAVTANALSGTASIQINGSAVGGGAGAVLLAIDGTVDVAEGAFVSGGLNGVGLIGGGSTAGTLQLHNAGTIKGGDVAIAGEIFGDAQTDFVIRNDGVLIGESGVAVRTDWGDDVLELTEQSEITGLVDLGDGEDRLVLDFNDDAAAGSVGQVAATVNVEYLAVETGTWRADTGNSVYGTIEIEEGAHLIVAQDNEFVSVIAPYIALDGRLDLELTSDTEPGELTGILMEGAGSLHLTGPAMMLVDDASGLQHTGGTFVENGALLLTDVYGGDIATSGEGTFVLGEGGDFTGNLVNDGTFIYAKAGDYDFLGDFTGSGLLEKYGDGRLTFTGFYGFAGTTSIFGGSVAFTGGLDEDIELNLEGGEVDLSQVEGGQQTISGLSGQSGSLQLGETNLVVQQAGNSQYNGTIAGSGQLTKTGAGDLKLNGDGSGFTGTGQVQGGTLSVNGNFGNANFVVEPGGTLGGAGTVGNTTVDGGTLAPGNSIDTLNVNGDIAFTAASVFEVEVDAAGNADRVNATGTATLGGATVNVIAASGTYRPLTDYTILTAAGGVNGTFGSVDINLAFLDPTLIYSANEVTLRLARNDIDFAAMGQTPNQRAIGALIESLGFGTTLYDETLTLIDEDVAANFASLTGEVYPAYGAAVVETAEMLRRQTAGSMTGEGGYAWATGIHHEVESTGISLGGQGVAGGVGFGGNGFSASAGLGKLEQTRGGDADSDITFAIGQVTYASPAGFSASAGVQFGWVGGVTSRRTQLGSIDETVTGRIDGEYRQFFGELGYRMAMGGLTVEPFAGISHLSVEFDGVTETGAPTALTVAGIDRDLTFGRLGVRLEGEAGSVRPFASAAYRRAWGDRTSIATVGFAGSTATALISAVPIAESGAELTAGLSVSHGPVEIEVGYDGLISDEFESHGLRAGVKLRF